MIAGDALFEFLYYFPGWPKSILGCANLVDAYSGYGKNILIHRGDGRVVTLEYEVHGTIVKTGGAYDNRFVSIVTIEDRKIARWRDYIWTLSGGVDGFESAS